MIDINLIKPTADEIVKLLEVKNKAYGSSTDMTYNIFGLNSYLVRMYDKINRLANLTNNGGKVNDESIEDTLRDLAGYSILALVQLKSETECYEADGRISKEILDKQFSAVPVPAINEF